MKCIMCGKELTSGDFNALTHGMCWRCKQDSRYPIGWKCPDCGMIYAPDVKECFNCNKVLTVSTAGGTIKISEE